MWNKLKMKSADDLIKLQLWQEFNSWSRFLSSKYTKRFAIVQQYVHAIFLNMGLIQLHYLIRKNSCKAPPESTGFFTEGGKILTQSMYC